VNRNSNCPERDLTPCTWQEIADDKAIGRELSLVETDDRQGPRAFKLTILQSGMIRASYPILPCIQLPREM
jgi:hypothetical protein